MTLVDDHLKKSREIFEDALRQGGILVNISGPSKSGKTVFVKNIVGGENLISISGAGVDAPKDLWLRVFHQIGTPVGVSEISENNTLATLGGTTKVSGTLFFAKAEASISAAGSAGTKDATTVSLAVDHLQLLIKELSGTGFVLFIDDFHYMGHEVQEAVARQIKEAIDKGVKIVCASVPHHSEDVLRANADLRGRIVSIDFDYWPAEALRQIPVRGFAYLNILASEPMLDKLVSEVAGSPQLMQSLCLSACLEMALRERSAVQKEVPELGDFYSNVCLRTAVVTDYSSTLEKLQEGPKTRGTDRAQFRLKDGTVGDVYTILLRAIALDPPNLHFRYSEIIERVKLVCERDTPVGSSLTGACVHIAQLANDGLARPIIDWDSTEDVFDVRDPYLMFYLRWNKPRL